MSRRSKFSFILFCTLLVLTDAKAQSDKPENIVVVTMDGLRWQEIFGGADSLLSYDTAAIYSTNYVRERFWMPTSNERRQKLMPFFWTEIAQKGLLLGNRSYGNYFNNANPYWFSYPGYNEIFTGFPDTSVNSNDKILNKNENVFEYLNKLPAFNGKAVVFGSWDVYAYIFNEQRSGLMVNDGFRDVGGKLTEPQKIFNQFQHEVPDIFNGGERLDAATFRIAFEYMKIHKPRLIYFGLGDTDEFAHAGRYDFYLDAITKSDAWIKQIWDYIQSTPGYAGKTTLLITTDHGRGLATGSNWRHHGQKIPESNQLWMAAIGAGIPAVGESRIAGQYYQGQIAATIAQLLGQQFNPAHKVLPALPVTAFRQKPM